jgi:3-oxoadipate enol-lactonase
MLSTRSTQEIIGSITSCDPMVQSVADERWRKPASQQVKQIIDIGCGEIHCEAQGEGPAVCLMSTLAGSWSAEARLLRKRNTVLTYDMRGYGESENFEPGFPSNQAHADDLVAILDRLGIAQIVLVGLSHGGAVAQHFAANHGERLRGLVIVSSFARASGPTRIFLKLLHGFLARNDLETFWEVLKAFLCSERNLTRMLRMETSLKRLMFDQYTCESLLHIYECSLSHDTRTLLPRIETPTLVVGGKEDMLFPPWITAEITALIPGAEERLLPTAHVPPVENVKAFHETLIEFLKRLDTGVDGHPEPIL